MSQQTLAPALVPPLSLLERLPGPVWGIDSQTTRTSLCVLHPGGLYADTESFSTSGCVGRRMAGVAGRLRVLWARARSVHGFPVAVAVEGLSPHRTIGNKDRQIQVLGLVHATLWIEVEKPADEVQANSWKARALGKGHGHAKPPEYVRWAESVTSWRRGPEHPEDEAAAIGVATAAAIRVLGG